MTFEKDMLEILNFFENEKLSKLFLEKFMYKKEILRRIATPYGSKWILDEQKAIKFIEKLSKENEMAKKDLLSKSW